MGVVHNSRKKAALITSASPTLLYVSTLSSSPALITSPYAAGECVVRWVGRNVDPKTPTVLTDTYVLALDTGVADHIVDCETKDWRALSRDDRGW